MYIPLTFKAVLWGVVEDMVRIFSSSELFQKQEGDLASGSSYTIFRMKTQISERDVFFDIWVYSTPDLTDEAEKVICEEPHAVLYSFSVDNKQSFDYMNQRREEYASLPGAIFSFPCSKKEAQVSDSEIKSVSVSKNIMYAEITGDDAVKIVKILTKIGRILRSDHEKKIDSMRPDGVEVHKIVRSGDIRLLEFCLFGELDPNNSKPRSAINSKDRRGMTPLHVAVSIGKKAVVEFLIRSGCNLNSKDKDQNTALHIAAAQGHIDIAQCLIFNGISVSAKEKTQLTYVGVAAREGNTTFLKKAIIDWDADPMEIKDLDLTGRQLKELPDFPWGKLENLRSIDLSGNNLDVIPVPFIHLPQLEKVILDGNPLRSIPERFRAPWPVLRDYIGSVGTKAARWTEKKLLFVGQEGVGKTTLLKSLKSRRHKVSCKENLSTDGIDIHENIAIESQTTVSFSAWDFGGQEVYYPSHQFFLKSNSVFLIVFNLADDDISRVEYWMKQIMVMNNSASSPIIIVGTHLDDKRCTPEYVEERIASLKHRFPTYRHVGFHGVIPVSCKNGQGMKKLIDSLYELIEKDPFPILPDSWVYFHEYINSYKKKLDYVNWSVYTGWARRCGVDMTDIYKCTDFLCDVGSLIYFNDTYGKLNDLVILNPQFLADLMSTLITFRHSWVKEGKLAIADLPQVLSRFDAALADSLLALLERFEIIHKIKGSEDYMVPSLLPNTLSKLAIFKVWPTEAPQGVYEFRRQYRFQFLPLGFFSRLMLRILHIPGMNGLLFWHDGFILQYHEQTAQVVFDGRNYVLTLAVRVNMNDHFPGMLLRNLVESVESLISGFYARVKDMVDRFVPCTHCIRFFKSLRDPYNFTYAECIAAIITGKNYIFCQNILSPSRCVMLGQLAPDIGFADIHLLDNSLLQIDKQLGQGGFGVVYSGTYKKIPVAIKELKFLLGNDEERVQKFREFQQEAWIMSLLDHPNVVRMLGCTVNPLRMVLELISQGDLFAFIHPKVMQDGKKVMITKGQQEIEWKLRFKIMLDIAVGMRHLHHGVNPPIIHRDLRSPNIFLQSVNADDEVCAKVADFGLAAMVMPDIAGSLGTWQWLAPEVIDRFGSTYDCRSDVYSFGIVFWELCSFEIPFLEYLPIEEYSCLAWDNTGKEIRQFNPEVMKDAIIEKNLRPTIPSGLPDGVKELITVCLSANAEDRPFFIDIVPRLCEISGLKAPPLEVILGTEVPSTPKYSIDVRPLPVAPSECKVLVQLCNTITVQQKIRCMMLLGDSIWITGSGGLLSRISNDGNEKKTIIVHKQGDESGTLLNIHSIVGVDNTVWGGAEDGSIIIWDAKTCKELNRWNAHGINVVKPLVLVHTAKGKAVWSASPIDKTVKVWDTSDFKMIAVVQSNKHPVYCLSQHQDFVWIGGNGELFVYNSVTYQLRGSWRAHESSISCILSLGNRVWTGSATGDIKVWEDKAATELLLLKELKIHCGKVLSLCKYQTHHVWSCALDKSTLIWDSKTFHPVQEIADDKESVSMIIRDGNNMWLASDKEINVYQYSSTRQVSSFSICNPTEPGPTRAPRTFFGANSGTISPRRKTLAPRLSLIGSSRDRSNN